MKTHEAKRVEITIEAVMQTRLTAALDEAGVTGYTILPVWGGSGRSGRWNRQGQPLRDLVGDGPELRRLPLRSVAKLRPRALLAQGALLVCVAPWYTLRFAGMRPAHRHHRRVQRPAFYRGGCG